MRLRVMRVLPLLLVVVGASARPAAAEGPAARSRPDSQTIAGLQASFARGEPARVVGPRVRWVLSAPLFTAEGVRESRPAPGEPALIPWAEIDRVQRRGRATREGAITGAVVGGVAGVVLGGLLASAFDTPSGRAVSGMAALGVVGGLGGAGCGAVVGTALHNWRDVHGKEAPRKPGSAWGLQDR